MGKKAEQDDLNKKIAALQAQAAKLATVPTLQWVRTKMVGKNEVPIPHRDNTEILFEHNGVTTRFNQMLRSVDVRFPNMDQFLESINSVGIIELEDMARAAGYPPTIIKDHIESIGAKNTFHPVREWIETAQWDGTDRFDDLFESMGIISDKELARKLLWRWCMSGIAAVYRKVDYGVSFHAEGVLVFMGKQGKGKTAWMKSLALDDMVREGLSLRLSDKDDLFKAESAWISELGELDATFRKSDISQLKAFITSRSDDLRKPYAAMPEHIERRSIYCGTVNEPEFLLDDENRRFYCVSIGDDINPNHGLDMQQFWAQMYLEWKAGEEDYDGDGVTMTPTPHWLNKSERIALDISNRAYAVTEPLDQKLDSLFFNPMIETVAANHGTGIWLNATAICEYLDMGAVNRKQTQQIAKFLSSRNYIRDGKTKAFFVGVRRVTNEADFATLQENAKEIAEPPR